MSLEKRLRYLEKAWKQRLAEREELPPDGGEAGGETGRKGGETGRTGPEAASTAREGPFASKRGWQPAGAYCLRRRLQFPSPLAEMRISQFLLPAGYAASDLLFFDTETTGLSGGAGNSIFLMGMAWIEAGALSVEQVFLKDFPGEGEFLSLLAERLNRHRVFVSYNGRAFDAHVLRTRFLLNRMALELEQQTDLLYWSRRLWRRVLPDCSLSTVEREILGIRRELDVPGFEIPGIYLEFLRSGRPGRLDAVLEHNLQDVRTLADLLVTVNSILLCRDRPGAAEPAGEADRSAGTGTADRTALGSFFLSRDESWGVELLKSAFSAGDEAAGRALSLYYKRAGAWQEAIDLWQQMARGRRSLFAALELAKYYEHRRRDAELALQWVQTILSWALPLNPQVRAEIHHRRRRLQKKLEPRSPTP